MISGSDFAACMILVCATVKEPIRASPSGSVQVDLFQTPLAYQCQWARILLHPSWRFSTKSGMEYRICRVNS